MPTSSWKLIIVFALVLGIQSCLQKQEYKATYLKIDSTICELNDQHYFSRITDFSGDKGSLIFTDYEKSEVVTVNKDFEITGKIGASGDGPFQYKNCSRIACNKSYYAIWDDSKLSFVFYDKAGDYSFQMKHPKNEFLNNNFVLTDQNFIYTSGIFGEQPYFKINLEGDVISNFGETKKILIPDFEYRPTMFHLVEGAEGMIFSVAQSEPLIEIIENDSVVKSIDLSQYSFLNKTLANNKSAIKKATAPMKFYGNLFESATYYNGALYILYRDRSIDDNHESKIIKFNYTNTDLVFDRLYTLEEYIDSRLFSTMTIFNQQLYLFNENSSCIVKYPLN